MLKTRAESLALLLPRASSSLTQGSSINVRVGDRNFEP